MSAIDDYGLACLRGQLDRLLDLRREVRRGTRTDVSEADVDEWVARCEGRIRDTERRRSAA